MYRITPGEVRLRVARRLRIGWPRQYSAVIGAGTYATTGNDVTLTYQPAADTTPAQFTFVDQTGAAVSTVVTSAAVTITGITAPITLNASGGTIDKNGDANFLGSQIVSNGDTVRARVTSSGSTATAVNCTVAASPSGVQDVFTVTTQASTGFDYYIGPSGSDANPGTVAQPWAMTAINSKRSTYAGKTVGFLDGTYNLYSIVQANNSWTLAALQPASGTALAPTVIKSVNPLGAHLYGGNPSGGARPTSESGAIGQHSSGASGATGGYVTIDGFAISRFMSRGVQFWYGGTQSTSWVATGFGVTIKNCEIYDIDNNSPGVGNNAGGILGANLNGALIQNNKIHDCYGGSATDKEGYGICTFTSTDCIVEYNTFYAISAVYYKQTGQSGHITRYNYIQTDTRNEASGMRESTSGGGSTNEQNFHHNIVVSRFPWNGTSFVAPPTNYTNVYNNTLYYDGNFAGGLFIPSTNGKTRSYNNIIYRTGSSADYLGDMSMVRNPRLVNCNCYPPNASSTTKLGLATDSSGAYGSPTLYTLANFRTQTGQDALSIAADPLFVSATLLDPTSFQLQGTSPCLNAGRSDGTTSGTVCDMGAWGNNPPTRIGCDF